MLLFDLLKSHFGEPKRIGRYYCYGTSQDQCNIVNQLKYIDLNNIEIHEGRGSSSVFSINAESRYVIKRDDNRLLRRLSGLFSFNDRIYGYRGVAGEALNTLYANISEAPSHVIVSLVFDLIKLRFFAVYKYLENMRSMHEIVECHGDKQEYLHKCANAIVELLTKTIDCNVYHGDANISNQFFSHDLADYAMIDYEVSLPVNCPREVAYMLQYTSAWDWRLSKFIDINVYRNIVAKKIEEIVVSRERYADLMSIFDRYVNGETYVTGEMRRDRLRAIKGVKKDIGGLRLWD